MKIRAAHDRMFVDFHPEQAGAVYQLTPGNSMPNGGPEGRVWSTPGAEMIFVLGQSWTEVGARVFAEGRKLILKEWEISDEFAARLGIGSDSDPSETGIG